LPSKLWGIGEEIPSKLRQQFVSVSRSVGRFDVFLTKILLSSGGHS